MKPKYEWFHGAGGWIEDQELENGNYQRECHECKEAFHGHKGRSMCKTCAYALLEKRIERLKDVRAELRLKRDHLQNAENIIVMYQELHEAIRELTGSDECTCSGCIVACLF